MITAFNSYDVALTTVTPAYAKSLLHSREEAAGSVGLYGNRY